MSSNEEVFDSLLLMVAQKSNGIEGLLENFFSFLGRKTDFYFPPDSDDPNLALNYCVKLVSQICRNAGASAIERRRLEKSRECLEEDKSRVKSAVREPTVKSKTSEIKAHEENINLDKVGEDDNVDKDTEEVDSDEDFDKGAPPGNGGKTDWYEWSQTLSALELLVRLPPGTSSKSIRVDATPKTLHVSIFGKQLFGGDLYDRIKSDEFLWGIVDGTTLQISLDKINTMQWWPCVIKGHPEIDVKRIIPENSKLSDLDPETRATVEKMMVEQRQKAMGIPSGAKASQLEALEKFKRAHPELDFSKANVNFG